MSERVLESTGVLDNSRHLLMMRTWRYVVGVADVMILLSFLLIPSLAGLALAMLLGGISMFLAASFFSLYHVTRAAAAEVSLGYALRHLLLALLLLPFLGLGVFAITRLVESEMNKWRLTERPAI